jgi:signal transduction histidine kinase/FixJ family two-component response regulator
MVSNRQSDPAGDRVLILAPIGRDAAAAAKLLQQAGIASFICRNMDDLLGQLEQGAGAALVAEEAFVREPDERLATWIEGQPSWSDFPFVVLTSAQGTGGLARRVRIIDIFRNVSLIERPAQSVTLVSAVQVALRARRRQYEVRSHLLEREQAARGLEDAVRARTADLEEANRRLRAEIDERERVEAALRQSQKMEAIGQMTGGVAHDFNNLLTVVVASLGMIERSVHDPKRVSRFAAAALAAANRGARLTQQLLAFARKQTLRPQTVNSNDLLREFDRLIRRAVNDDIEVHQESDPALVLCQVDPAQFEAAILNLVVNARDAMPNGGRLTIATRNAEFSPEDSALRPEIKPGRYAMIAVSDTGEGIAPDDLSRVFEPFYTTKEVGKGTGLGLSQVYGFVKQSGGHVAIDSALGAGTTVRIYLPEATDPAPRDELPLPEDTEQSMAEVTATILVVEDDPHVRELAVETLRDLKYRVLSAENGPAALDILARPERIDALFTDVIMPRGMNGVQLAQEAKRRRHDIKVLLTSGYTDQALSPLQDSSERYPLLAKPYQASDLERQIRDVLNRHERDRPTARRLHVLLVEDDALVRMATVDMLEALGHKTFEAANAKAALTVLQDHDSIDVLLTDVGLPDMKGPELVALVRERRPDIRVVFATGYDHVGATGDGRLNAFVKKPYTQEVLAHALAAL